MDEVEFTELEVTDSSDDNFAQLIVLMRIYDVLMADLTVKEPSRARALLEAHAKGVIFGPVPAYNGVHMVKEDSGDTGDSPEDDNSLES